MLPLKRHTDPAIQAEFNNLCRWVAVLQAAVVTAETLATEAQTDLAELEEITDLVTAATAPTDPPEGKHWLDTSVDPAELKVWTGLEWMVIGPEESGGSGGGTEIIGAIDRDVTLAETLVAGDIVQVRGEAGIVSLSSVCELTASDATAYDRFGSGVAYNALGTMLAVGAKDWEGANANCGGVYVYDWTDGAWAQRGTVLSGENVNDYFGTSVALSADGAILAVGAPGYGDSGGVYIFDWNGTAWVQRGSVIEQSLVAGADFGRAVALSSAGTRLAVGTPNVNYGVYFAAGSVILLDYDGSAWNTQGAVFGGTGTLLGVAAALSSDGQTLVAGMEKRGGYTGNGGVAVYDLYGSYWEMRGIPFSPDDTANYDYFGSGVALSADGEVMVVGAEQWEGTLTNQGGVYIYDRSGTAWVQRGAVLISPEVAAGSKFGHSVALTANGSRMAIGAYYEAVVMGGSKPEAGVVYTGSIDVDNTLKAYKSVSPTSPIPSDLYYIGIMNESGSADEVKSAKMVFWTDDPLEPLT